MRKILFLSLLFAATMLSAQSPVELPLWPDGAPNTNGLTGEQEDLKGGRVANVTHPSITVYRPAKAQRYGCHYVPRRRIHPSCHEPRRARHGSLVHDARHHVCGTEVPHAERAQRGSPVGCRASHPPGTQTCRGMGCQPQPYRYHGSIRRRTSGSFPCHVIRQRRYPSRLPDTVLSRHLHAERRDPQRFRQNLIGETLSAELEQKYSLERQVSPKTPQAFIMLSADDATVLPINGIGYFLALREQKVPATLHVYPTGGHGWGFRDSFTYKRQWTGELEKWLREGLTFPEK